MSPKLIAYIAGSVSIVSLAMIAIPNQAATTVAPLISLATLPPEPTPPPAVNLPGRELMRPNDVAAIQVDANANGAGANGNFNISQGVIGVILNGDDSMASILTPQGIKYVRIGDLFDGKRVIDISMLGVRLNDGKLIPRGLGVNPNGATGAAGEAAPQNIVPPIGGTMPGTTTDNTLPPRAGIVQLSEPAPQQQYGSGTAPGGVNIGGPQQTQIINPFNVPTPSAQLPGTLPGTQPGGVTVGPPQQTPILNPFSVPTPLGGPPQ
jgi:hypothetical protein